MSWLRNYHVSLIALLGFCAVPLACPAGSSGPPDPPAEAVTELRAGGAARALVVEDGAMWSATGAAVERWRLVKDRAERAVSAPQPGLVTDVARRGDRLAATVQRPGGDGQVVLLDAVTLEAVTTVELEAPSRPTSVLLEEDRLIVGDMERGMLVFPREGDVLENPTRTELFGIVQLEAAGSRVYVGTGGFGLGIGVTVLDAETLDALGQASFGDAFSFAVDDSDTMALVTLSGLQVLDVGDLGDVRTLATNPDVLSRFVLALPGRFVVPAEDGVWVVVHDGDSGFVAGPAAAPTMGALAIGGDERHVVVATDRARVLTFSAPDTSPAPGSPAIRLLSQTTPDLCTTCTTVAVDGELALAGSRAGVSVGDAGALETLSVARTETLDAVIEDVIVEDGVAYVADWSFGVRVIDVGDPSRAQEIATLQTGGFPSAVAKTGDLLLVGESTNGGFLRVIDVSDPYAPVLVGSALTAKARDVAVQGARAYVADESLGDLPGGVRVFDIRAPRTPREVQHDDTCANALAVAASERTVIAACDYDGIVVYDVAPNGTLTVRHQRADLAPAWSVDLDGELAVVGTHEAVHALDVTDPALESLAILPTGALVRQVHLEDDRVVAAASDAGLYQWPRSTLTER